MDVKKEPLKHRRLIQVLAKDRPIKEEDESEEEDGLFEYVEVDNFDHIDIKPKPYFNEIEVAGEKNIELVDEETTLKNDAGVDEVTIYIDAPNSPFSHNDKDVYMLDTEEATIYCDSQIQSLTSDYNTEKPSKKFKSDFSGSAIDDDQYCPHCLVPGFTSQRLQDHVEQCELDRKSSKDIAEDGILFFCNTCSMLFSSEINLENHMKSHDAQNFKCPECRMVLTTEKNLKRHMKVHTSDVYDGKGFPCSICRRVLSNRGNLTRHMSTHYEEGDVEFIPGLHSCLPCKKNFISKILLLKHMENHKRVSITGQSFICNVCGKTFANQGNLGRHMLVHSDTKEFLCPVCDYKATQKANLQRHIQTHRKDEEHVFPCEICGEKYTRITLKMHKLQHKYNNSLVCTICGKEFQRFVKLDKHMETHNVIKEIDCFFCDRKFTSRQEYNKHMDINHQDKYGTLQSVPNKDSYSVCLKCYKIFNHYCMLKEHMRSHDNDNKFSCTECNFSCRKKSRLMLHLKSQCDTIGVHKCQLCERVYYNKQHLIRHTLTAHSHEKPYECSECEYKTSHVHYLHTHLKTIHYRGKPLVYKFECEKCIGKFASKAELDQHIESHKTNKECPYCEYVSISDKDMKKHEKMCKISTESISCPECKRKFKSYLLLEKHIELVHADDIITSDAAPFYCEYCDRYFNFSHSLKKHMLRHHGTELLQLSCEECDYKASCEESLEIHIAEEHEECTGFSCLICEFKTGESSTLKNHIEKEHPDENDNIEMNFDKKTIYSCPECEERFIDRNLLKNHLILEHL